MQNILSVKEIQKSGYTVYYFFYKNKKTSDFETINNELYQAIFELGVKPVNHFMVGDSSMLKPWIKAKNSVFDDDELPQHWLHTKQTGDNYSGYFTTIKGASVKTLVSDTFISKNFETPNFKLVYIGQVLPKNIKLSSEIQTESAYNSLKKALTFNGLNFKHIFRMWFYNNPILNLHSNVNVIKNIFITPHDEYSKSLPPNTCINVDNPYKAALVISALAAIPKNNKISIKNIESPFNNCIEIKDELDRTLFISGATSINNTDEILFTDDVSKQIDKTLELIQTVIENNNYSWKNMTRAVVYLVNTKDSKLFKAKCKDLGIPLMPIIIAPTTMCRGNSLFELEADFSNLI